VALAVEGETREALLDAAEALFAAEGIGGVSLAAITRLAGQHNGGAIHYYYFGGRDGLLAAILDRHEAVLDEVRRHCCIMRNRLLDGRAVRSKWMNSRAVTDPFAVCGEEDLSPSGASARAVGLNATVPYELGVEAEPRLRVAAAFDELIDTI
jgi:AcrR family transcriptional regulator